MPITSRPTPGESSDYYHRYIDAVPEGDLLDTLAGRGAHLHRVLATLPQDRHDHRYQPGKWSIKEVLGHVTDAERVFAYRALRFARRDPTPLAGFEQDEWMSTAPFANRSLASLLDEFTHLRKSNIALFSSFDDSTLSRMGVASNNPISVRALLYILAGHEIHHTQILTSRYL